MAKRSIGRQSQLYIG